MLYYYGGKFHPWTRGHFSVLKGLLDKIQSDGSWKKGDKILIGVTTLKDERGVEGHHLCSSEEYRMYLIDPTIEYLKGKYDFIKDDEAIDMVCQREPSTYEFLERYCGTYLGMANWKKDVTLILGDDEFGDLSDSVEDPTHAKWKHAEELWKFEMFVAKRDGVGDTISATKVRDILHRNPYASFDEVKNYIDKSVFEAIKAYRLYWQLGYEDDYRREENVAMQEYDITKFPRPSATVDMMIIRRPNVQPEPSIEDCEILLVRRKNFPYKGFWALPGGFLDINDDESLEDAARRELVEEIGEDFPFTPANQFRTYSDMGVDPRGRIVDTVYVATKGDWFPRAGDDACEVDFFPLSDLPRMAFCHRRIVDDYITFRRDAENDSEGEQEQNGFG